MARIPDDEIERLKKRNPHRASGERPRRRAQTHRRQPRRPLPVPRRPHAVAHRPRRESQRRSHRGRGRRQPLMRQMFATAADRVRYGRSTAGFGVSAATGFEHIPGEPRHRHRTGSLARYSLPPDVPWAPWRGTRFRRLRPPLPACASSPAGPDRRR